MHDTIEVAMLLLNNSSLGGAERRFAQVYEELKNRKASVRLVINESLLEKLIRAQLLGSVDRPALVVREWIGRALGAVSRDGTGKESSLRFMFRKVDYLIASVGVGVWIIRHRPKVLHLILGGAYVVLPLQLMGWAPPAIVSITCPNLREMVGSGVGYKLYRLSLRFAYRVDALTESVRDALHRIEGIAPARIAVSAGSCVNTVRFQPAAIRQPWVVFSGRLIPEKNPDLFIEACALVHQRVPHAKFYVLGEGPLRDLVEESVCRHGLESCAVIKWCEGVESILKQAQVCVSAQRMDNYPSQALLEAMACGAAIVATDVGLTWKLVDESVGFRVSATPAAIAEAVIHLLEHPAEATAMGQRGRARVVQDHSIGSYLDYLQQIYADTSSRKWSHQCFCWS